MLIYIISVTYSRIINFRCFMKRGVSHVNKKILAAGSVVDLISFVMFQAPILKSAEATATNIQSVVINGNQQGGSSVTGSNSKIQANNNIAYVTVIKNFF